MSRLASRRYANIASIKQRQREEKKKRLLEIKRLQEEKQERIYMKLEDYDADPETLFPQLGKTEQSDSLSDEDSLGGGSMYVYKQ